MVDLVIQNNNNIYTPILKGEMTLESNRKGSPSTLKFNVLKDETINFQEGNAVALKINNKELFFGFIFIKQRGKDNIIQVTAYDQLRYLKNKDTYVYTNKTASEVITMIADDFMLQIGNIEDTSYKIPSRIEDNTTLFDIILNALDLTLSNNNQIYVMYDDFGKINLRNIGSMIVPLLINEETAETFSYTSSIDEETYNQIKLVYENGKRDIYIAKDSTNINSWGLLQYFDTLDDGENGQVKADTLIALYNKKTRSLSVNNVFGDTRIRAGCMVVVQLDLGDIITSNLMIVENCKHRFEEGNHFMDLTLIGGEFVA